MIICYTVNCVTWLSVIQSTIYHKNGTQKTFAEGPLEKNYFVSNRLFLKMPYNLKWSSNLPALGNGETSKCEVSDGLSESTLKWRSKSHHFTGNIPWIFHLLNVFPVQHLPGLFWSIFWVICIFYKIEEEERKLEAAIEEIEKQNAEVNTELKELEQKSNRFNELEER